MKQKLLIIAMLAFSFAWINVKATETEPNNTPATANILPYNGSNNGIINPVGDVDWYTLTTTSDGELNITFNNFSNADYLRLYLYDKNGSTLINNFYVTTKNSGVLSTDGLAAGTYYIEITGYNSTDTGTYSLSNTLIPPPVANDAEPDSNRATALTLPVNASKTGHLGYYYNNHRDSSDWYKVTTTADGLLRLKITTEPSTLNAYINCTLYDNDGKIVLNQNTTGAATTSTLSTDGLAAGTYYIALTQYTNTDYVSYVLADSLFTPPVANDKEPDSNRATALVLPLDGSTTGHLGYYYNDHRDSSDWYKVTTTGDGLLQLNITTEPSTIDAYLNCTLYDNNGKIVLNQNTTGHATSTTLNTDGLAAGTYYIALTQYNLTDYVSYVLADTLIVAPVANDAEPDSNRATAITLPINSRTTGHLGYYYNDHRDSSDWYKVTIPSDGMISLNITTEPSTIDAYLNCTLYDNNGKIALNQNTTGHATSTTLNTDGLAAGTYYIAMTQYDLGDYVSYVLTDTLRTYQYSSDSNYEPNGHASQAKTIPSDETTDGHFGFYYNNVRDTTDWFKIYYTGTGNLSLIFNHLPHLINGQIDYVNFYVYKDTAESPLYANTFGSETTDQVNLTSLAKGYYYVKITQYNSNDFEAYSLKDSFTQGSKASLKFISADTAADCSGTSSLTYKCSGSHEPYSVTLYRFNTVYATRKPTNSNDFTFGNLPPGEYHAKVYGDGATGSDYSTSKTDTLMPVPAGLNAVTVLKTTATVAWDTLTCVNYYSLQYRKLGAANWTTVSPRVISYKITGLTGGTTYECRVASFDTSGTETAKSPYSDSISFTTTSSLDEGQESITASARLETNTSASGIVVYPNPASSQIHLQFSNAATDKITNSTSSVWLKDMNGKMLWGNSSVNTSTGSLSIDVSRFPAGMYILEIINSDRSVTVKKVLIAH